VGLYEQIKRRHPNSQLFGFLKGPIGIYTGKYMEIKDDVVGYFKNRGTPHLSIARWFRYDSERATQDRN
jgi:6-phosphofructokinase